MSRASSLYRLQELDLELEGSHRRIDEINHVLGDDQALNRCLAVLESAEGVVREKSAAKLGAEHAVASQKTKIAQNEKALYGGAVRNPKELQDLQQEFGLTYLFISHDLSVVKYISDRVAVMYLGKIVELSEAQELFSDPKHPYTEALMSAVPVPDPDYKVEQILLEGDVPSPLNPPPGCYFHPRCRYAKDICANEAPAYIDTGNEHFVACHFWDSLSLRRASAKRPRSRAVISRYAKR